MINKYKEIDNILKINLNNINAKEKINSLNLNNYLYHYNNYLIKQYKHYKNYDYNKLKKKNKILFKNKNFSKNKLIETKNLNTVKNQQFIICKSIKLKKYKTTNKIREKVKWSKKINNLKIKIETKENISVSEEEPSNGNFFKYIIKTGNNHNLLIKILKNNNIWLKSSNYSKKCNFIWSFKRPHLSFDFMNKNNILYNHFEFNYELSQKDKLFYNIKLYCNQNKINYDFLPLTFIFDMSNANFENQISKFCKIFRYYQLKNQYQKFNDSNSKRKKLNINSKHILDILKTYKFKFDFLKLPQIKNNNDDFLEKINELNKTPKDLNENLNKRI